MRQDDEIVTVPPDSLVGSQGVDLVTDLFEAARRLERDFQEAGIAGSHRLVGGTLRQRPVQLSLPIEFHDQVLAVDP